MLPNDGTTVFGDQILKGYTGQDKITGGRGDDRFVYDKPAKNLLNGGLSGEPTGDDTFALSAGVVIAGSTIHGTNFNFDDVPRSGEINTIEAIGNNDLSIADIFRINKIVYNGASVLMFGGGNFFGTNHILPTATIVGNAGANSMVVWLNPADIKPGHSDARGSSDLNISKLIFQSWTAGQDKVTIMAAKTGLAGTPNITAPKVNTVIVGGENEENLNGNIGNDTITGNGGADIINGGAGNDTLNGGVGADTMNGGAGNDTYTIDNAGDTIVDPAAGGGTDIASTSLSYTLAANVSVDTLKLSNPASTAALKLTGNNLINNLIGGAGANTLRRWGRRRHLRGLGANDLYMVDHASETIVEAANGGTDTVRSGVSFTLKPGVSVENLQTLGQRPRPRQAGRQRIRQYHHRQRRHQHARWRGRQRHHQRRRRQRFGRRRPRHATR